MYFIVTGQILIFTDKDREAEQDLARLGPLDHFGEQGLLSMNAGKRTASARATEPSKLIRISGELIKNMLAHESKLVSQLEKIGREQQEISREDRKVQLLLRLSRSRSSLSLQVPRYPDKFSSLLVGVDFKRQVLQLDEVMSEYRNPIRADDTVTVTGSIAGTPIVFKSKVLESKIVDGSTLYECAMPDEMVYEQQRAQFRLELGAASRAEASVVKEGKKYRGKISDVSERGAAFRLRRGVPINKGDCIDHVELMLTPEISIQPKIEIMNVLDVARAPKPSAIWRSIFRYFKRRRGSAQNVHARTRAQASANESAVNRTTRFEHPLFLSLTWHNSWSPHLWLVRMSPAA